MNELEFAQRFNRRHFLTQTSLGLGAMALGALWQKGLLAQSAGSVQKAAPGLPHLPAKAKRVIYLFQSGAPSQLELFDYKPALVDRRGKDLPNSIRMGQRITTMTSGQKTLPVAPSIFRFAQHGKSGLWLSDLLPHTAKMADDICLIRSMHTEAINHDPAITFCQTGSQIAGRPSMGAWVAYGLGSLNEDLPSYVVLVSRGTGNPNDQPLYDRLWGSGFLPTKFQGVKLRSGNEPVLYLVNPAGCGQQTRRSMLDDLRQLNEIKSETVGDPEITTRIAQYELAYRMQSAVPELVDVSKEPAHIIDQYGPDVRKPGTFAYNCLLARRLAERGVRFVQLFHMGWDQHNNLPSAIRKQCGDTDQASAALVQDLKQRGMLDDTLVVWGGEFGRTVYSQGALTQDNYGRDHHPRCYSLWLAGAGVRGGLTFGETDEFSYNIIRDPVHVHDLHATILYLLGIEHTQLTYRFQGRDFRLTDIAGELVRDILA